jgi:hypothetical protein
MARVGGGSVEVFHVGSPFRMNREAPKIGVQELPIKQTMTNPIFWKARACKRN